MLIALMFLFFMVEFSETRQPVVAGQFYPADKEELISEIKNYFENVKTLPTPKGELLGIISPHAGYVFSGQVAAYSYKFLLQYNIKNPIVILIGQSHHYYLKKASLYPKGNFKTPLGEVEIQQDFVELLLNNKQCFEAATQPHLPEHSLEVQIPFLQYTFKEFTIVPILVSKFDYDFTLKISKALAEAIKSYQKERKIIIVCSTDMSHYPSYEDAKKVDAQAIELLKHYDTKKFYNELPKIESAEVVNLYCVFCGETAVGITLETTKLLGGNLIEVLNYSNSGDTKFGEKTRVVGYLAAAFIKDTSKKEKQIAMKEETQSEFKISKESQKILLSLARQAIKEYVSSGKIIEYKTDNKELLTPQAVFVTLTKKGHLRGCIGTTFPQYPLYQAVINMAIAAATEDPRFPQVTLEEIEDIKIEISVLSPLKRVFSHKDIKEKLHGVVVRRGGRSGLFLPQVWEQLPKKEQFLSELCWGKAGLPPNAWQDPKTELYVFTVVSFEE
ncbi:MAG: AmmeMemoRadiSam system protein B [Endomicrobiia bacterium]